MASYLVIHFGDKIFDQSCHFLLLATCLDKEPVILALSQVLPLPHEEEARIRVPGQPRTEQTVPLRHLAALLKENLREFFSDVIAFILCLLDLHPGRKRRDLVRMNVALALSVRNRNLFQSTDFEQDRRKDNEALLRTSQETNLVVTITCNWPRSRDVPIF